MTEIKCNRCNLIKSKDCYVKNKYMADGVNNHICKDCNKIIPPPSKLEEIDILDAFDYDLCSNVIISGTTNSGKSTILQHILQKKLIDMYDLVLFFSFSIDITTYDYLKLYSNVMRFGDFNPQIIDFLFKFQSETNRLLRILIVFDDMIGQFFTSMGSASNQILQLFTRGRNFKISVIYSTQSIVYLHKQARVNCMKVILLHQNAGPAKERAIKEFLSTNVKLPRKMTSEEKNNYLLNFLDEHTRDHGALYINQLGDHDVYKIKQFL